MFWRSLTVNSVSKYLPNLSHSSDSIVLQYYVLNHSLECLAGGVVLRGEAMGSVTIEATSKRASAHLRDELISSGTALPLLLLIAQVRTKTLFETESKQLKLISYLYDTCQDVLMQFTDFLLSGSKAITSVASLMPSMQVCNCQ